MKCLLLSNLFSHFIKSIRNDYLRLANLTDLDFFFFLQFMIQCKYICMYIDSDQVHFRFVILGDQTDRKKTERWKTWKEYFSRFGFIRRELRNYLLNVSGSDNRCHRSSDYGLSTMPETKIWILRFLDVSVWLLRNLAGK